MDYITLIMDNMNNGLQIRNCIQKLVHVNLVRLGQHVVRIQVSGPKYGHQVFLVDFLFSGIKHNL